MSEPVKCIAWCPDDCDESDAREYFGDTAEGIAEQHAMWMHGQGDPQEEYNVRVRETNGDVVREWDVCVDVEIEVSFMASLTFLRKVEPKEQAK